jgi:predicted ATP-grasp superfamily ATP-dependent carboligase
MGAISRRGSAFAWTRQWLSPLPRRPYRYGGAVGPLTPDPDLEARLVDACLALARELGLVGLVSFDFLLADGEAALLEVNPRPGATLEVLDDEAGSLFRAHVEACRGADPASVLEARWRPPAARAAAFLYADRGPITVTRTDWPLWAADRPRPGTAIGARQPVATVLAETTDIGSAEAKCRGRLGLLADMLYEGRNGKGAPQ